MIGRRKRVATHPMNVDATVHAHWPELSDLLSRHRLEARFVAAEDESVDDVIEVRRLGAGEDHDLGDIQIASDGSDFCAASWTSSAHVERRRGGLRLTVSEALDDLITNLRKDSML